ncbi:hypothetical protein ABE137_03555 [Brevibacillus laterosporus]|uniref:Uncharacterized protein n=2 Tax=Brevibacillus TaxID=55080 RepID=A0A0F7C1A5_BRELA|nr:MULTISPECIES: hypothetical protein [Brevibacillus]AKF95432.1 hypothetical protein EX87_17570 [Brevibacillus laterosporus]MCR8986179.1 hypothetical protein [Brevibacillus laterosporus]MCZ0831912.1 hypothetical protein [Brevibacillus halotolerans]OAJ75100.1 hypothetical protein AYJ08_05630 [Brevibacillus sp. SKDU10]GIO00290.1 hypothetical protein J5TS2_09580 [Brevibacillus halotolerans]
MSAGIVAIITTRKGDIAGGAPIFFAKDNQEMQEMAFTLEKITDAMIHQITPEILVIVRHK